MRTIIPESTDPRDMHQFLLGSIAPRPIAFVSTIDENGIPNLAPYSYFNAFSSNPPIAIFSSNLRVGNASAKDTLDNVWLNREVVINLVNYEIVRQMAITAVEFPSEINEFEKAGLIPIESELVKPFRVKESPVQLECKVSQIHQLGNEGGAGNLIVCEILRMHIREDVINDRNRIDPHKMDLVGRMGRSFYVRASGDAVFPVVQSILKPAIGFDRLPKHLRESPILTGNEIAQIAGMASRPTEEAILTQRNILENARILELYQTDPKTTIRLLHQEIRSALKSLEMERAAALAWLLE
ncbi:MAG: flavin reductase family protein [Bacteroidota bacterium]